jgi:hypothetical protein
LTFEVLLYRLRDLLREKVRNGELTERGMARATGVSQPHLHNILKGIRALPPELADQLLALSGLNLPSLLGTAPETKTGASVDGTSRELEKLVSPADTPPSTLPSYVLAPDASMEPRFHGGDIVYYHQSSRDRTILKAQAAYLVNHNGGALVRYLRMGGQRLYLASEESLQNPVQWDYVSLTDRHILEIVRGRIVWICRKMEEAEAGAS